MKELKIQQILKYKELEELNCDLYQSPLSEVKGASLKNGWKEGKSWWIRKKAVKYLTSRQDKAVTHIGLQQLWFLPQDLYSMKSVKIPI